MPDTYTTPNDGINRGRKAIREASTLVIAARDPSLPQNRATPGNNFDYRILFLQRQGRFGSFAGASVFPGGVVDAADFSPDWYRLYGDLGIARGCDFGWGHLEGKPRAGPIATSREDGLLPNDVAFRICTIRETFEESGILLAGRRGDVQSSRSLMEGKKFAPSTCAIQEQGHIGGGGLPGQLPCDSLKRWRKLVHDDASRFVNMCREFNLFPDIWSIYELSNVLTPRLPGLKRYDTMFYICTLNDVPEVEIDQKEITSYQWLTPAEGIRLKSRHEIDLPLPQITACARLLNFPRLTSVQGYAASRMDSGMDPLVPAVFKLTDAIIRVLPGDDCYPGQHSSDEAPSLFMDESDAENLARCKNLNRFTETADGHFRLICNISLPHGQRPPRSIDSRDWTGSSRL